VFRVPCHRISVQQDGWDLVAAVARAGPRCGVENDEVLAH